MQEIFIRRASKVYVIPAENKADALDRATAIPCLATMLKNLQSLGYTLSGEVLDALGTHQRENQIIIYDQIIKILRKLVGADKKYAPMYPNFPRQVMEASDAELFLNAMAHYLGDWFGVRIMPEYDKVKREALEIPSDLKVIGLGTKEEYHKMFQNLMSSKTSISGTDREDLVQYIEETLAYEEELVLPDEIPHKENLATVVATTIKANVYVPIDKYLKTPTDILRLACVMSEGDASLAQNTRFRNFKRRERRLLLEALNNCSQPEEDMYRYKGQWTRLGEKLHPGDYRKAYPKAMAAFIVLREGMTPPRFNSYVEAALLEKKVKQSMSLLSKRPGEFARRLDHLLRLDGTDNTVASEFSKVAGNVSTPVLLQLREHFIHRNEDKENRIFFPKGQVAKAKVIPNKLEKLPKDACTDIVHICEGALKDKFAELPKMEETYIDEELKNYNVPFSQRSASKALKTIVRGSKLPLGDENTLRFFIWWKDIEKPYKQRVDIDLSAVFLTDSWDQHSHISYTRLRDKWNLACHSGDITSAPDGACEFIDVDIQRAREDGIRYVIMNVLSFTGQPFTHMPECYAGFMTRDKAQEGEIFEASTVKNKIDLASDTRLSIPMIIDLYERKVIWADLAVTSRCSWVRNVERNAGGISYAAQAIVETAKPNLYDLFKFHAEARGATLVDDAEEAKTIFSVDEGITPYDIEAIMGEYL